MAVILFELLDKLEFGGESPLTIRAWCSTFRYCPDPLGIVTAEQFDKLELAYFLSGKKVITAPTIPKMVKITDHLKLKSNTGAFPKPSIKRILTKIIAIPCSCFFIQSHSYYNKFGSGARQPAGLHSISCLSYNKRSNWLATHSLVLPCP